MKLAILPLCALSFDEDAVRSLPFGQAERERLCSIGNPVRATQSLGALLALSRLVEHDALPIRRTSEGKPCFDAPNAPLFSLAHSEHFAVAALGNLNEGCVGVDIEEIRASSPKERISRRFFSADEQAMLAANPTEETFLKLWTAKEATAKMNGLGLSSLLANDTPSSLYKRHFRIVSDGCTAILCVTAEQPLQAIEWLCPPTLPIFECERSPHV